LLTLPYGIKHLNESRHHKFFPELFFIFVLLFFLQKYLIYMYLFIPSNPTVDTALFSLEGVV